MCSAPLVTSPNASNIQIAPVRDKQDLLAFVEFPFMLYRGDPYWVPPFIEERLQFLDPKKNPFFDHARHQLFLARRAGDLVGTIGVAIDEDYNSLHNERMAAFGFFETIDNQEVADVLLGAAEQWARKQGMDFIRGPMNFTTNHEVGLLIDGFDSQPVIMSTYNPRYYARLIGARGYTKAMDLYSYIGELDERIKNAPPKVYRVAESATKKAGIRIRKVNMRDFDEEVRRAREVYDQAWERNWGFVPLTEAEVKFLAKNIKPLIDPDLVLLAETSDGKPIGISITLPDYNQPLRLAGGGRMFPFGVLKFLWHRKKVTQARLWTMGVVKEYRSRGIDAVFYVETARAALAKGYTHLDGSWILESNTMMNRIIERLGGQRYKTHRIYDKPLGTSG